MSVEAPANRASEAVKTTQAEPNTATDHHLDLVRQVFARLEALDPRAAARLCHDEFELRWTGVGHQGHEHRGREAFERHLSELSEGWDEVHVKCDRVARSGADRIHAMYHLLGHLPGGGTAESPHAAVVKIRDDRVWRFDAFQDAAHSFDWLAAQARLA
jgi:ketosteroid isomerase-like protein